MVLFLDAEEKTGCDKITKTEYCKEGEMRVTLQMSKPPHIVIGVMPEPTFSGVRASEVR